jgi:hypothetical protein
VKNQLLLHGSGLEVPTEKQQRILRWLEAHTYQEVASKLGVSKTYVGHLAQRWCEWIKKNSLRIGRSRIKPVKTKEPRQGREPKRHVLSFRLTGAQVDRLISTVGDEPLKKRCSIHQIARSVLVMAVSGMAPR